MAPPTEVEVGLGRRAVIAGILLVQPCLAEGMGRRLMAVVTTAGAVSIKPVAVVAGVADGQIWQQGPVRYTAVVPGFARRHTRAGRSEVTQEATHTTDSALEIIAVTRPARVWILNRRSTVERVALVVDPGLPEGVICPDVTVMAGAGQISVQPIAVMAGIADQNASRELSMRNAAMQPVAAGRHPCSGRSEVALKATDAAGAPGEVSAVTRLAAIRVLLSDRAVEDGTLRIDPGLTDGVGDADMTIVTGCRAVTVLPVELMATVANGNTGRQLIVWNGPVDPDSSGRDPAAVGAKVAASATDTAAPALQIAAVTALAEGDVLRCRAAVISGNGRVEPGFTKGMRWVGMTVVTGGGAIAVEPVALVAGIADGDLIGIRHVRNRPMLPIGTDRHLAAVRSEMTGRAADATAATEEVGAVTGLAEHTPLLTDDAAMETGLFLVDPRLSEGMGRGEMAIVAGSGPIPVQAILGVAGFADTVVGGQIAMRDRAVRPARSDRYLAPLRGKVAGGAADTTDPSGQITPVTRETAGRS